ncbi:hypothetical protein DW993_02370 [Clostridium sp. AM51-4]|nr:hypothetical protein DW993_02370 [Clostridium sp. AM51-4]RHV52874.1 hypothetical protein DXB45_07680 [Clostridium sp. OM04-12AA]
MRRFYLVLSWEKVYRRICLALFLWYLVYSCLTQFCRLSKKAGILLVPYLVWLTYVGYLNFMISILN